MSNESTEGKIYGVDKNLIYLGGGIAALIIIRSIIKVFQDMFKNKKKDNTEESDYEQSEVKDAGYYDITNKQKEQFIKDNKQKAIEIVKKIEVSTAFPGGLQTDEDKLFSAMLEIKSQIMYDLVKSVYYERNRDNKIEGKTLEDQLRNELGDSELDSIKWNLKFYNIKNGL